MNWSSGVVTSFGGERRRCGGTCGSLSGIRSSTITVGVVLHEASAGKLRLSATAWSATHFRFSTSVLSRIVCFGANLHSLMSSEFTHLLMLIGNVLNCLWLSGSRVSDVIQGSTFNM